MSTILHKRSAVVALVPNAVDLIVGELAVNTADGKVFTKRTNGAVQEIGNQLNIDGGGASEIFSNDLNIDGGGV